MRSKLTSLRGRREHRRSELVSVRQSNKILDSSLSVPSVEVMTTLNNGSTNNENGLIPYSISNDHIFEGGYILDEDEDGSVYDRDSVDGKIKELIEYIEILRSESFEARGHAAVVSCILRDFDEATIWSKLQWALKPKTKR